MATITTTTSLSFDAAASLTVGVDKNFEGRIAFTSANDDVWPSFTVTKPQSKVYGPFGIAMTVVITVVNGSLDYTINGGNGGFGYDTDGNITGLVSGDEIILPIGAGLVDTTVTATGTLPITALGRITPVDAAGATTQTLPSAATAWALKPYGVVVLVQRGAGVPSFAAGGGDTLRATSGIGACVQYGMIAAQVQSATEWALA